MKEIQNFLLLADESKKFILLHISDRVRKFTCMVCIIQKRTKLWWQTLRHVSWMTCKKLGLCPGSTPALGFCSLSQSSQDNEGHRLAPIRPGFQSRPGTGYFLDRLLCVFPVPDRKLEMTSPAWSQVPRPVVFIALKVICYEGACTEVRGNFVGAIPVLPPRGAQDETQSVRLGHMHFYLQSYFTGSFLAFSRKHCFKKKSL